MSIYILKVIKNIKGKYSIKIHGIFKKEEDAIKYREIIFKEELNTSTYNIVDDYKEDEFDIENNNEFLRVIIDMIPEDHLGSYCLALGTKPSDILKEVLSL